MIEALRFTLVAVAGVLVDIAAAYALVRHTDVPLWLAATAGFALGALLNYVAHEIWTFRDGARRMSLRRALRYFAGTLVILATRLLVVTLLEAWVGNSYPLAILIAGAGTSFIVNFVLSKFFIFTSTEPRS